VTLFARAKAIAFGFSDLSVAVISAQVGIQGRVTGFGALDSRLRGNDRGEKGNSIRSRSFVSSSPCSLVSVAVSPFANSFS
jgi:hypothetical protein